MFGSSCSCATLLYILHIRLKTIATSSPVHLFPNQLLFIMAYSLFGPQSCGWQGDKNAGKMNRWQVALHLTESERERELLAEERNDNTADNILSN